MGYLLSIRPAWPELVLGLMICLNVVWTAFCGQTYRRCAYWLALISLLITWALLWHNTAVMTTGLFNGLFVWDHLAWLLKIVLLPVVALVFWSSLATVEVRDMAMSHYWVLACIAVLGMMVLISSDHLLSLFMGVELMSLPIYAMVALDRHNGVATEAAIKYFVMGALATGILLFGMSLVYGGTGLLSLSAIAHQLQSGGAMDLSLVVFGMVLLVVAIAFKLGAAPFHMWVPDVYRGAPHPVTLLIATVAKLAAFAMAARLLVVAFPALFSQWQLLLMIVAIASMALGNFVAIMQTDFRRLLAYSSIAHMGYMLLGFVSGSADGYASACFYQITYALSAMGAFGVVVYLGRAGEPVEQISDLAGLSHRRPGLAFVLLLLLFSMAGIPPMVGFWAKLGVLESLIQMHMVWLAALALVFAIVGVFYYIRVIKVIYFEEQAARNGWHAMSFGECVTAWGGAFMVLGLGVMPSMLFHYCRWVFIA